MEDRINVSDLLLRNDLRPISCASKALGIFALAFRGGSLFSSEATIPGVAIGREYVRQVALSWISRFYGYDSPVKFITDFVEVAQLVCNVVVSLVVSISKWLLE